MPIFYVDYNILQHKLDCIVCPMRLSKLFLKEGICGEIYKAAGDELLDLFQHNIPLDGGNLSITEGLKLSNKVIHIVVPEFVLDCFTDEIYNTYMEVFDAIRENKFNSIVFPPLPYSYKRVGNMNSYKTSLNFIKYFLEYEPVDYNFYIMVDKRTMQDHLDNYTSTYVSTSFPISKRHKQRNYPFVTKKKLDDYVKKNKKISDDVALLKQKDYNVVLTNTKYEPIYKMIKDLYSDDKTFCLLANINPKHYINMFNGDYTPSKYELLAMLIALRLPINTIEEMLSLANYKLELTEKSDVYIIYLLNQGIYDITTLNEKLFLSDFQQLGSYTKPNI